MKFLKILGIIIVVIIALFLIIAAFVKKDYSVERQVSIDRNPREVFAFVKFLKNQEQYSKWNSMDPDMKKEYRGVDGTVGFVSAWESEKKEVGKGEQEIKNITEGKRIDYELRFKEPFESTEFAYMSCEPDSASGTKVIWGFNGRMNYPMNIMLLFMDIENMIGEDLQIGLNNLKGIMETMPEGQKTE